jgi:shikimate dehydrogenase
MQVNKSTRICISIAEKPGIFGLEFHNKGYELLGLNFVYFPLKVLAKDLESSMQLVRDNIHGCSVTMPHKIEVIKYLDELDDSALRTGAVNTILNTDGILKGYNTDYYGAKEALKSLSIKGKEVLLLGAGGVSRAIAYAVKDLGGNLTITNRTEFKALELAQKVGAETISWDSRNLKKYYLLINGTKIGMEDNEQMPIDETALKNFNAVMDVVVADTRLARNAKSSGLQVIYGRTMTTYQAAKQFEIYTEKNLPQSFLEEFMARK